MCRDDTSLFCFLSHAFLLPIACTRRLAYALNYITQGSSPPSQPVYCRVSGQSTATLPWALVATVSLSCLFHGLPLPRRYLYELLLL